MSKSEMKVWRVGNFVIRRREVPTFGSDEWGLTENQVFDRVRKGRMGVVECLEASSLDGAWAVRIMPGSQMETLLLAYLGDGDGDDVPSKDWVDVVLTNLMSVTAIPNGHFHKALALLLSAYCDPSLVDGGFFGGKTRRFLKELRGVRDDFLEWRKSYDAYMESIPVNDEADSAKLSAEEILNDSPEEE